MEASHNGIESVTMSEILGLTWERQRTSEELQAFISRRHEQLGLVEFDDQE